MIPQFDGTGRGLSSHPYPKAKNDGPFELRQVGGDTITLCKKTGRQVKIVGNYVHYLPKK